MQLTDAFTDASGAMTTQESIMKETFYEKKPTRHMQITAVFGDLQSTGKDDNDPTINKTTIFSN